MARRGVAGAEPACFSTERFRAKRPGFRLARCGQAAQAFGAEKNLKTEGNFQVEIPLGFLQACAEPFSPPRAPSRWSPA